MPPPPAAAEQQVEDGHADRHAVRDLVEDHRVRPVGHLARDLDAAVHGPGVQDQHVLLRALHALLGEAEAAVVLAGGREEAARSSARAGCAASSPRPRPRPPRRSGASPAPAPRCPGGIRVGGPQSTTSAPILVSSHRFERATRLCRMSPTIATRRPLSRPLRWRRVRASSSAWVGMLVGPVPRVHDRGAAVAGQEVRARPTTACRITIMSGFIASRFLAVSSSVSPFVHARGGGGDREAVRRQHPLRDLERRARARRGLVEEVDDRLAAQGRDLLDRPVQDLLEAVRGVEDGLDVAGLEGLDAQQVAVREAAHRRRLRAFGAGGALRLSAGPWRRRVPASLVPAAPPRPVRPLPRAAPAPSRRGPWSGSCPRSRRGWAARGGRGPRAPPARSAPGRPKSMSSSRAARTVRPVKSTSSTSTTVRPSMENGMSVPLVTGWAAMVVKSSR